MIWLNLELTKLRSLQCSHLSSSFFKKFINSRVVYCLFVCLFVCLGFFVPLENLLLIWRRHYYRWRATTYFDICSALKDIEQWATCHTYCDTGQMFIYNGYFRGSVKLTPIAERMAVELSRLRSVPTGDRTPTSRMRGERSPTTPLRRCWLLQNKDLWFSTKVHKYFQDTYPTL